MARIRIKSNLNAKRIHGNTCRQRLICRVKGRKAVVANPLVRGPLVANYGTAHHVRFSKSASEVQKIDHAVFWGRDSYSPGSILNQKLTE